VLACLLHRTRPWRLMCSCACILPARLLQCLQAGFVCHHHTMFLHVCAGVDLDYEPSNSNCVVKSTGVTCATDAESVAVTTALRNALPKGQYLLSTASWHVGCYGEGAFTASQPGSIYTGDCTQ